MKKAIPALLPALLLTAMLLSLAGCGSSSGSSTSSGPSGPGPAVNSIEQRAGAAAREANLRLIDSAIEAYYASTGAWPTSISQLSGYFARGVPTDPLGGTYYLINKGGQVRAAVR